jgi:hypothetical protein
LPTIVIDLAGKRQLYKSAGFADQVNAVIIGPETLGDYRDESK